MSPEKQRIAIAEICGWKPIKFKDPKERPAWEKEGQTTPEGFSLHWLNELPDYPASLDAMHEALLWLPIEQRDNFEVELAVVVFGPHIRHFVRYQDFKTTNASAAQRREAFLKTHNRWEEGV